MFEHEWTDDEPEFASPESVPSLGADWPKLLRTFADMEDALSRLHKHLDDMRPQSAPTPTDPPIRRFPRRAA